MMETIKKISDWEILTPSGWRDFSGIKQVYAHQYRKIIFSDGSELSGANDHMIQVSNSEFRRLDSLFIGYELEYLNISIVDIELIDDLIDLYDVMDVDGGNVYYTNQFVSHNCGMGNQYHKMWVQATEGIAEPGLDKFNPILLKWDLHPDRDEKWRKLQDTQLGIRMAAQECDASFVSSGHTVIEGETIQWYLDECVQEPLEKRGVGGEYWIWAYPDYTKNYMVVSDISRGDSADYSSFHVLDVETLDQVAEFKGMIGTRQFGSFLVSVATDYNQALLVIPNRNMGWDVVNEVIQIGYSNLYYSYKQDPFLDENIHLRKNYDLKDKSDKIPGFTETAPVRAVMISKLITYLLEKSVKIKSRRTCNELQTFIWLNGKAQAAPGYNDDLVIPYGIGLYMHDIALKLRLLGIDLTRRALNKTFKSVYVPSRNSHPSWEIDAGKGKESLTWLLSKKNL